MDSKIHPLYRSHISSQTDVEIRGFSAGEAGVAAAAFSAAAAAASSASDDSCDVDLPPLLLLLFLGGGRTPSLGGNAKLRVLWLRPERADETERAPRIRCG